MEIKTVKYGKNGVPHTVIRVVETPEEKLEFWGTSMRVKQRLEKALKDISEKEKQKDKEKAREIAKKLETEFAL